MRPQDKKNNDKNDEKQGSGSSTLTSTIKLAKSKFSSKSGSKGSDSSVAPTLIISEATTGTRKFVAQTGDGMSIDSDLMTDNLENVGLPPEISEFTLEHEAKGTLSDPMVISDNSSSRSSRTSRTFGRSYGSTQFSRGHWKHFLRFQRRKDYDEEAYEKRIEKRIREFEDEINKT